MTRTKVTSIFNNKTFQWITIALFALFIAFFSWIKYPNGGLDMRDDILPSLFNWKTPWVEGMPLFPWSTFVLMPLRLLTPRFATMVINTCSVILLTLIIKKYNGNPLFTIPIILSPIGTTLLNNGQTDIIVLSGLLLPAGFDLLLLWKPQVTLHAYWVRVKNNPWLYIGSMTTLILSSFIIWGFWPKEILEFGKGHLLSGWWNKSLWPWSIPIGLFFVHLSIRNSDDGYGVIASPFLFPYVNNQSYIGLLALIACKWPRFFIACYLGYLILLLITSR